VVLAFVDRVPSQPYEVIFGCGGPVVDETPAPRRSFDPLEGERTELRSHFDLSERRSRRLDVIATEFDPLVPVHPNEAWDLLDLGEYHTLPLDK
jgi:hypothetical protein